MVTDLEMDTINSFLRKYSKSPVVIMFYGATCGPCLAAKPLYEELAANYHSNNSIIKFARFHAWESDESKKLTQEKWNVNGVPNFRTFYQQKTIALREGGGLLQDLDNFIVSSLYMYNTLKNS